MMPDHVHLLLSIPPKTSVSSFMGYTASSEHDELLSFFAKRSESNYDKTKAKAAYEKFLDFSAVVQIKEKESLNNKEL